MKMKLMKSKQRNIITIINVYAPTSERVNTDITELNELYTQLRNLVVDYKKHGSLP